MRPLGIACLGLLLALAGAVPSRAQLAPIDGPFSITSAEGSHASPLLAARPDGSSLVVWTTTLGSSRTLSGRFFGPGGAPLGPPFAIATGQIGASAVALLPDGGFVAVWEQGLEILGSLHDRDGRVRVPAFQIVAGFKSAPAVAVNAAGDWMVVWEELATSGDLNIAGSWFGPDGTPRIPPLRLSSATPGVLELAPGVAALPGGGFVAGWAYISRGFPGEEVLVIRPFSAAGVPGPEGAVLDGGLPRFLPLPDGQGLVLESWPAVGNPELVRLDAAGLPAGPPVRVGDKNFGVVGTAGLDAAGRLLLVGRGRGPQLLGQLYDTTLFHPLGARFEIPTALPASSQPVFAAARPGQFLMVWEDEGRLFGEILVQGCEAPGLGLCLAEGRFRVEVSWRDAQGGSVKAHAVPLRDDTGSFWFFSPSNPELLIKILDGRSLNGHFWVFYGSLSDVAYEIRVVDTATGNVRIYTNPAGTLASRADVRAFPADGDPAPVVPRKPAAWLTPRAATSGCHSSDVALCLNSSYQVTIDFVDPGTGATHAARAVPFSTESGAFWFFDEANLELFVKVLDGTAVNGHIWIFHGALTNVEYTLTVRGPDAAEWTYHNPRGRMHSGADTSALPTSALPAP